MTSSAACLACTAYTCIANIKQHYNNQQGLTYVPYYAHTLCTGCHLGWQSVTVHPVPPLAIGIGINVSAYCFLSEVLSVMISESG